MKKAAFFCLVSLLFLLQISPVLPFAEKGIRPDIVLILAVFSAVWFPLCGGAFFVFALSCLMEVFSGVNSGLYPLLYLSVFMSIRSLEGFFDFTRPLNLLLVAFFSLAVKCCFLLFCFNFIYEYQHFEIAGPFIKESVYTLLVFPALYLLLLPLYKKQKETFELKDAFLTHEQLHR